MAGLEDRLKEAKELERQGKWKEVDEILTSEIGDIRGREKDCPEAADVFNQRGVARRMLGQYGDALVDYQSALMFASKNDQRALALVGQADIQRLDKKDFRAAHESLDGAKLYAEEGSLTFAKVLDFEGLTCVAERAYIAAINSYRLAREVSEELYGRTPEDKDVANRHAQIMHHLGAANMLMVEEKLKDTGYRLTEYDKKSLEEASELNLETLRISQDIGFLHGIYLAVTTIGRIAGVQDDWDKALEHYRKAEEILEKTGYKRAITVVSLLFAEAYLAKSHLGEGQRRLGRFKQGFLEGEITGTDKEMLREKVQRLSDMHSRKTPTLTGIFDELAVDNYISLVK